MEDERYPATSTNNGQDDKNTNNMNIAAVQVHTDMEDDNQAHNHPHREDDNHVHK